MKYMHEKTKTQMNQKKGDKLTTTTDSKSTQCKKK